MHPFLCSLLEKSEWEHLANTSQASAMPKMMATLLRASAFCWLTDGKQIATHGLFNDSWQLFISISCTLLCDYAQPAPPWLSSWLIERFSSCQADMFVVSKRPWLMRRILQHLFCPPCTLPLLQDRDFLFQRRKTDSNVCFLIHSDFFISTQDTNHLTTFWAASLPFYPKFNS